MYGKYFQYDGELSTSYNLIIGGLEHNDPTFGMSREAIRGEFNRFRNRLGHMGSKWSEPLSFTISLMKDVCSESSQSNLIFTEEEVNAINAWLTSPDYPTLFHMYDYDFERDSLNNMVLIDSPEAAATFTVQAEGYIPMTYELEGNHCRMIYDESYDGELLIPPKPRVEWIDGFYSLQFYTDEFPAKILSISSNNVEYNKIKTNEWLSMYQTLRNVNEYMD